MEKKYVRFIGEFGQMDLTSGKRYAANMVARDCAEIVDDSGVGICVLVGTPSGHLKDLGVFEFCEQEQVHVRPIMTQEARDILDRIHENVGAETRSESIVKFMEKSTELGVELCAVKVQLSTLEEQSKRRIENLDTKASMTEASRDFWKSECELAADTIEKEKDKRKGWIIYSAIVAVYAIGVSVYCLIGG